MANKRTMLCGKEIIAVGEENSLADKKQRLKACLNCIRFRRKCGECVYHDWAMEKCKKYNEYNISIYSLACNNYKEQNNGND